MWSVLKKICCMRKIKTYLQVQDAFRIFAIWTPIKIKDKFKATLQMLEQRGIIISVNEPVDW